jgi:hypothetical protein
MTLSQLANQLYTSKLESAAPSIVAGVSQSIAAALSSIRQVHVAVVNQTAKLGLHFSTQQQSSIFTIFHAHTPGC